MSHPLRHFANAYALFALVGLGAGFGWLGGSIANQTEDVIPVQACVAAGGGAGLLLWFGFLALYADSKRYRSRPRRTKPRSAKRPNHVIHPYQRRLLTFLSRNVTRKEIDRNNPRMAFWQRETVTKRTNPRSGSFFRRILIHIAELVRGSKGRKSNNR